MALIVSFLSFRLERQNVKIRKFSPKSLCTTGSIVLIILFLQVACASVPVASLCSGAGCYAIAKSEPWPNNVVVSGISLTFRGISMVIPSDPSAMASLPDALLVKYADGASVLVALTNGRGSLSPVPQGISAREWADVLFSRTPNDINPNAALANNKWEEIIQSKAVMIGDGLVSVYRQTPITLYRVRSETLQPYSDDMIIFDDRKADEFFRIGTKNLPHALVDKILASIKIK